MKGTYPEAVNRRFRSAAFAGELEGPDAIGAAVSFVCGVSVKFHIRIDPATKTISAVSFATNGCGYAVSAADLLAEEVSRRKLTDLHGLEDLHALVAKEPGVLPNTRTHCLETAFDALKSALAEYRGSLVEEWTGEKALICSCFGVSEDTIEDLIKANPAADVDEVGRLCNAGTGCGSCQFLIREIIESESAAID